jgi:hypothetical protein
MNPDYHRRFENQDRFQVRFVCGDASRVAEQRVARWGLPQERWPHQRAQAGVNGRFRMALI